MWQYIIPAISAILVAVVEALGCSSLVVLGMV